MKWEVVYVVGNTYKKKIVEAETNMKAIKKARIKNIVDLIQINEREREK